MALEKPGKLGEFFSPTLWPPSPYAVRFISYFCHFSLGRGPNVGCDPDGCVLLVCCKRYVVNMITD